MCEKKFHLETISPSFPDTFKRSPYKTMKTTCHISVVSRHKNKKFYVMRKFHNYTKQETKNKDRYFRFKMYLLPWNPKSDFIVPVLRIEGPQDNIMYLLKRLYREF